MTAGPTPEEIAAAEGKSVEDVIDYGLRVLFCGINPGLYSGAVGHHFARPGNRFWKSLHRSGLTIGLLSPGEEHRLLDYGYGVTNLVNRATPSASDLDRDELVRGGRRLLKKLEEYRPDTLAVLGLGAYRKAFGESRVDVGRQQRPVGGSVLWVLPSPSGRNAHYGLEDLAELFAELRRDVWGDGPEDIAGEGTR
jgi:TDG/mug DNA glycosylase family protein